MKNNIKKSVLAMLVTILMLTIVFSTCFTVEATYKYNMKLKSIKNNIKITLSGTGVIEGTVKRWGKGPLENAYIYLAGGHIDLSEFDISIVVSQEQTDLEGKYRFDDVPVGLYTILVLRNDFGSIRDNWLPGFRYTRVYAGETTVENFELIALSRNIPIQILPRLLQFQ